MIYKATQVDGIYTKDPKKYKNAKWLKGSLMTNICHRISEF